MTGTGFGGPGGRALLAALVLAAVACLPWQQQRRQAVFNYIAVVDITRSMNAADYRTESGVLSRLEFVKKSLARLVADLPCGSRFGLGVFTERRSALLFEPIETCAGYPAIAAALEHLDWRMAWAADSRIAAGLRNGLETLGGFDARLLFITDGQEAPPLNPRYKTSFDTLRSRAEGLVIGAGGLTPVPIPKFDEAGRNVGYVAMDEVPQRSTFGLSELPPEDIEGYHARNAPFGNREASGSEHLSALREDYLRQVAAEAGLGYHRLETAEGFLEALTRPELAGFRETAADLRWLPALLAVAALTLAYLADYIHDPTKRS